MARLDELLPLARAVEQEVDEEIVRAREQGESWTMIGCALGVSKQGAQHRYRIAMTRSGRATTPGWTPRTMAEMDVKQAGHGAE